LLDSLLQERWVTGKRKDWQNGILEAWEVRGRPAALILWI